MNEEQIKIVLAKIIETVDIIADETAELVDKYHRPYTAADSLHTIRDRSLALIVASRNMRQAASTLLGIPDRQAGQEELP